LERPSQRPLALALVGIECVRCAHIVRQPLPSTSSSHLFVACGAAPWRRLETRQALQEPISPNRPTRRGVTTRNLPSATGPRKRAGSIRRRRRSKQRRTSAARAQRRVFYGAAINPTARRQRGGLLPALPVRFELHVRHGAPRVRRAASPLNLCLRSPEVARALARGLRRALRAPGGSGLELGITLAACNTLENRSKRAESGKRDCWS